MSLRYEVSKRLALAASLPAFVLAGCYVVPIAPDGTPLYPAPGHVVTYPPSPPAPPPGTAAGRPIAKELPVKLYPINDLANQTGVLTGSVTNMMTGRGRFTFLYQGETLVGEATRVANDERRGVASAYGPRGTYARCEYQMSTAQMGAGTCAFSNGAQYQVHIGG
jgi:hypothetical protein